MKKKREEIFQKPLDNRHKVCYTIITKEKKGIESNGKV